MSINIEYHRYIPLYLKLFKNKAYFGLDEQVVYGEEERLVITLLLSLQPFGLSS